MPPGLPVFLYVLPLQVQSPLDNFPMRAMLACYMHTAHEALLG